MPIARSTSAGKRGSAGERLEMAAKRAEAFRDIGRRGRFGRAAVGRWPLCRGRTPLGHPGARDRILEQVEERANLPGEISRRRGRLRGRARRPARPSVSTASAMARSTAIKRIGYPASALAGPDQAGAELRRCILPASRPVQSPSIRAALAARRPAE
ncbi:MAG: hypothetical protein FJX61_07620 [Alphaproteobacteria bacterium]|nr:hypothetical protein [Alphaproteobacteria bacterium]